MTRYLGRNANLRVSITTLALVFVFGEMPGHAWQSRPAEADGILQFQRAADSYAFLHRRLERRLPAVEVNANPDTIRIAIAAMAAAIRQARPDAQPGELFNPAAAGTIRDRIARALRSHGYKPADVRAAERAGGIDTSVVALHVNGSFPWLVGTAMFPCISEVLPPIPPELQYRLVGRDLVLIDVHASLIVDILPLALADELTADN